MLSQNQVVKVRAAIEKTYDGLCDIIEKESSVNKFGITTDVDFVAFEKVPCKLSFESSNSYYSAKSAKNNGINSSLSQSVKLFIAPEINIKAGSKIIVTKNNEKFEYQQSGQPSKFDTHQEIKLEIAKKWA